MYEFELDGDSNSSCFRKLNIQLLKHLAFCCFLCSMLTGILAEPVQGQCQCKRQSARMMRGSSACCQYPDCCNAQQSCNPCASGYSHLALPNNNVAADGGLAPTDNNLAPSMDNFVPTPDASSTGQAPRSSNLGLVGVSRGGSGIAVADGFYLDDAIIRNQMRLRFDAGFNNIFPDRAEFFYAQCGCFGPPAPGPGAAGVFESGVDYQEYSAYFEFAARPKFSGFLEVPVRSINPEVNANESGFSDLIVGGKFALIACKDRWATLQFKVYTPTGDASKGLGTGHASLEPGILLFRKLTNRLSLQAEVRDWIPLSDSTNGGLPFDGNVLRYGIGTAYDIFQSGGFGCCDPSRRLTAVTEVVGWSVLGGQKTAFNVGAVDATGDTIVNLKLGLRYTAGNRSIGFGWGHALTGATWYEDIARLEYRVAF